MADKSREGIFQDYMPGPEPKVLYDVEDDDRANPYERVNLFSHWPEKVAIQAKSIACLVPIRNLQKVGSSYRINTDQVKTLAKFVVKSEVNPLTKRPKKFEGKFGKEPVLGRGTAFLVSKKHVLTAGHCFYKKDDKTKEYAKDEDGNYILEDHLVANTRVVFGFALEHKKWKTEEISLSQVFEIRHVTKIARNPEEGDWALVKLKKTPEGIDPLELDFINMVRDPISIYMLGHPVGLPLKYTFRGEVVEGDKGESDSHFGAKIDAFHGNSGSPIFNKAGRVIGMLTKGNPKDYDEYYDSFHPHRATPDEIEKYGHEKCQRMTALPEDIIGKIIELNLGEITYEPREKIIVDLEKVEQLLDDSNVQEAVLILQSLAKRGMQVANCALAKLAPTELDRESSKHAAEESGLFSKDTIDRIIDLLSTKLQPVQNIQKIEQHGQGSFVANNINAPIIMNFVDDRVKKK